MLTVYVRDTNAVNIGFFHITHSSRRRDGGESSHPVNSLTDLGFQAGVVDLRLWHVDARNVHGLENGWTVQNNEDGLWAIQVSKNIVKVCSSTLS